MVLWCCTVLSGTGQLTPSLLMFLEIITPVKCVTAAIPRYDGHLCHPEKGGLYQYQ